MQWEQIAVAWNRVPNTYFWIWLNQTDGAWGGSSLWGSYVMIILYRGTIHLPGYSVPAAHTVCKSINHIYIWDLSAFPYRHERLQRFLLWSLGLINRIMYYERMGRHILCTCLLQFIKPNWTVCSHRLTAVGLAIKSRTPILSWSLSLFVSGNQSRDVKWRLLAGVSHGVDVFVWPLSFDPSYSGTTLTHLSNRAGFVVSLKWLKHRLVMS